MGVCPQHNQCTIRKTPDRGHRQCAEKSRRLTLRPGLPIVARPRLVMLILRRSTQQPQTPVAQLHNRCLNTVVAPTHTKMLTPGLMRRRRHNRTGRLPRQPFVIRNMKLHTPMPVMMRHQNPASVIHENRPTHDPSQSQQIISVVTPTIRQLPVPRYRQPLAVDPTATEEHMTPHRLDPNPLTRPRIAGKTRSLLRNSTKIRRMRIRGLTLRPSFSIILTQQIEPTFPIPGVMPNLTIIHPHKTPTAIRWRHTHHTRCRYPTPKHHSTNHNPDPADYRNTLHCKTSPSPTPNSTPSNRSPQPATPHHRTWSISRNSCTQCCRPT